MTDTPIYRDMITEAKRRTKRGSPERARLERLDIDTRPKKVASATAARRTIGAQGAQDVPVEKRTARVFGGAR